MWRGIEEGGVSEAANLPPSKYNDDENFSTKKKIKTTITFLVFVVSVYPFRSPRTKI